MEDEEVSQMLDAVSDRVRRDIVFLLGENGRLNVGEITSHFRLSRPAISHHLKVLREAAIIRSEKVGQEIFYWLDIAHVVAQLHALADEIERCSAEVQPKNGSPPE